tara:strand:+ start:37 stop:504 length:468 start_codon:yes stop_codon:yes gene_type:complete
MIITCPRCEKKFEIDQKLIPAEGRMLQCGSCDHQWFFKINAPEKKIVNEEVLTPKEVEKKEIVSINSFPNDVNKNSKKKISSETYNSIKIEQKTKKNYNFLNILLVVIISITALILILDTFKVNLEPVFPNIKFFLNNLYQSIEDIKLFIFDLIK